MLESGGNKVQTGGIMHRSGGITLRGGEIRKFAPLLSIDYNEEK